MNPFRMAWTLLGVESDQGVIGFVQYFGGLPVILVGFHIRAADAMSWMWLEVSLLITGPADSTTLATVSAWCERHRVLPESLNLGQRNLEDVFLELTGRELTP